MTTKTTKDQTSRKKPARPDPPAAPGEDDEPHYDAAIAAAAFTKLEPRLSALPAEQIATPNADIPTVVSRLLKIAAAAADPPERARFAELPEFDSANVDDLESAAWALWHARVEYLAAAAGTTVATLPPDLVQEGTDTRSRMMHVLGYHFAKNAKVMLELDAIRQGAGYLDLAMDLSRLARLYHGHKATLNHDRSHYRAGDQRRALELSKRITTAIRAAENPAAAWADKQARAWTLLRRIYEEVAAGGRFLHRHTDAATAFPPLNALQPRRSRRAEKPEEPAPGEGGPPPQGG
jgi:hypothetical protein